jgi:hypothetical protein
VILACGEAIHISKGPPPEAVHSGDSAVLDRESPKGDATKLMNPYFVYTKGSAVGDKA